MTAAARLPAGLAVLLALIAAAAIGVPAWLVAHAPHIMPHHRVHVAPRRVVPKAELPPVEPVAFEQLDPQDARAFNAEVPFVDGPVPAARAFRLTGDVDQRARAVDCMASAVLYEAGDDPTGQRAVAQVVINRVRHPAFPKTICGVVFQGSERSTGCQFTFTCDGALDRHHWSDAQWTRARAIATAALAGKVFGKVGYATHYHTDWVVPYWQSSLDKIAAVGSHLFFRWTGWWGTPPAFNRQVSTDEPVIAALATYSPAHRAAAAPVDPAAAITAIAAGTPIEPGAAAAPLVPAQDHDEDSFLLTLDPRKLAPDGFAQLALRTCGDRAYCKVMAWTEHTGAPAMLPLTTKQVGSMAFSYLRDRSRGFDKALWNCGEFPRADPAQCMKVQVYVPAGRSSDSFRLEGMPGATRPTGIPTLAADGLSGIRRKPDVPAAKPAPPLDPR